MTKRYYTVVYEITDEAAFQRVMGAANGAMETGTGLIPDVAVSACGIGDVMTAYDALDDHVTSIGYVPDDVVREFCNEREIDADSVIG